MTLNTAFSARELLQTLLKNRSKIMVSTSLIIFWQNMLGTTQRRRLTLQPSVLPVSILISMLPLIELPLPSLPDQARPFSFMGLEALARHTSTIPFAITFALRTRLFSVLHPLASLHSFSRVDILLTPASKSLSSVMSPQSATSPKDQTWQS